MRRRRPEVQQGRTGAFAPTLRGLGAQPQYAATEIPRRRAVRLATRRFSLLVVFSARRIACDARPVVTCRAEATTSTTEGQYEVLRLSRKLEVIWSDRAIRNDGGGDNSASRREVNDRRTRQPSRPQ